MLFRSEPEDDVLVEPLPREEIVSAAWGQGLWPEATRKLTGTLRPPSVA